MEKPIVVCLCGSTKFRDYYEIAMIQEELFGRIVLSIPFSYITQDQKIQADELHFRRIDIADEILVFDIGGYIGRSTANEIAYAINKGKKIRYWSKEVFRHD